MLLNAIKQFQGQLNLVFNFGVLRLHFDQVIEVVFGVGKFSLILRVFEDLYGPVIFTEDDQHLHRFGDKIVFKE